MFTSLFDRVVVMTLDRRFANDEATVLAELRSRQISSQIFLVGDGKLYDSSEYGHIDVDAEPRRQAFNYAVAFQKVIQQARADGVQRLLYLEDDAQLTARFDEILPQAVAELGAAGFPWDMFFLGGNHRNGSVVRLSEHLIQPTYTLDLHAVAFAASAFPHLLDIQPSAHHTIDGVIGAKQRAGLLTALAVHPSIVVQKAGWSYNENKFVDRSANYEV